MSFGKQAGSVAARLQPRGGSPLDFQLPPARPSPFTLPRKGNFLREPLPRRGVEAALLKGTGASGIDSKALAAFPPFLSPALDSAPGNILKRRGRRCSSTPAPEMGTRSEFVSFLKKLKSSAR